MNLIVWESRITPNRIKYYLLTMGIISWALFGLLAGAIARWIYPGKQGYGILTTMGIGIAGGLLGGWAGSVFFDVGVRGFDWRSLLVAVLGAMFVIWVWERIRK